MTWAAIASALILSGVVLITAKMISKQLIVIHDLVNSNLARVTTDFELAKQRIETLEEHISKEEGRH